MSRSKWIWCSLIGIALLIGEAKAEEIAVAISTGRAATFEFGQRLSAEKNGSWQDLPFEGGTMTCSLESGGVAWRGKVFEKLKLDGGRGGLRFGSKRYPGSILIEVRKGTLQVLNLVDLEVYLEGVVMKEITHTWPVELLKTQAIIARTFAKKRIAQSRAKGKSFALGDTYLDQVYGGLNPHASIAAAVRETHGQVLTYHGKPIEAFYHSCCGGKTELPERVWSSRLPYYSTVTCPYCTSCPDFVWEFKVDLGEFAQLVRKKESRLGQVAAVRVLEKDAAHRNTKVLVRDLDGTEVTLTGDQLRSMIGYLRLKSTWFEVRIEGSKLFFLGSGAGHGVGLCQWGARKMAETGKSAAEILRFYYPKADLTVALPKP